MTFYTDDWGLGSVAFRRQQKSSNRNNADSYGQMSHVPTFHHSLSLRTFLTAILGILT